jgi:prevent-host-death family protein
MAPPQSGEGDGIRTRADVYTTGEARDRFSQLINEAAYGAQRVVLTRHGKNVAAVVPISDLDLLNQLERIIDVEQARKALSEAQNGRTLSVEEIKRALGL